MGPCIRGCGKLHQSVNPYENVNNVEYVRADCVNHVPPPGRDHKILARGQPQFRPEAEGRGRN